jgi:DNA-binding NtrC family response regulator
MLHHQATVSVEEQPSSKTILVIENDEGIGEVFHFALSQDSSYTPLLARTADKAVNILSRTAVHLLLIDYHLADLDGLALYDLLHAQGAFEHIPAILMSASLEQHMQEVAQRHLATLRKPFDLDDLFNAVNNALG